MEDWQRAHGALTRKAILKGTIMAKISIHNLTKRYGNMTALKNVSLEIDNGEFLVLLGPSGCGKSTFIRTLNRMHELIPGAGFSGKVLFNGQDIYESTVDPTTVRLKIGMVFQKPNPFPGKFGFHEIFHSLTVLAFMSHWTAALLIALNPIAGSFGG